MADGLIGELPHAVPQDRAGERLSHIDAMRGVGAILVVAGHTLLFLKQPIYAFHMPLFFFLSGMTFRPKPWRGLILRRSRQLLVPYLCYVLAITIGLVALGRLSGGDADAPLRLVRNAVLGGSHLKHHLATAWFVTCLLGALLAYNELRLRLGAADRASMAVAALLMLAAGYAAWGVETPLAMGVAPVAMFFLWAGEAYFAARARLRIPLFASLIAALAGMLLYDPYNMKHATYGTPVLSLMTAIAVCDLISRFCLWLPEGGRARRWLAGLGRSSLGVMFIHPPLFTALGHYVGQVPNFVLTMLGTLLIIGWLRGRGPLLQEVLLGNRATGIEAAPAGAPGASAMPIEQPATTLPTIGRRPAPIGPEWVAFDSFADRPPGGESTDERIVAARQSRR